MRGNSKITAKMLGKEIGFAPHNVHAHISAIETLG
jgi:hypothetical protein